MEKTRELIMMSNFVDQTDYERWKQGCRESFQKLIVDPGRSIVICLGGAGSNFANRFNDDGLDSTVSTVFMSKSNAYPTRATYKIQMSSLNTDVKTQLITILKNEEIRNVVIVCGLARSSGSIASEMGKYLKNEGFKVFVACFYPFSFEYKGLLDQADRNLFTLRELNLDGILLIENDKVKSFASKEALLPDVMALIDEPIKEFIFRICAFEKKNMEEISQSAFTPTYEAEVEEIINNMKEI